jgi:DNA replication protein DnaC
MPDIMTATVSSITRGQDMIPKDSDTMLIYGSSGSGKTHFAGSFGDRTLYINIGSGISTLYGAKFQSMYGKWNGI